MTEQETKAAAEPPLDCNVIPPEMLDLVRFMCATWAAADRFVYQHCDGEALMHYPVVQGTSNQIRLQRSESNRTMPPTSARP